MNDADMIKRWSVSYFDAPGSMRPLTDADRRKAEEEYRRDPAEAMMGNVVEAQRDLRETTRRYFDAKQDGLFDWDRYGSCSDKVREQWIAAADIVTGDYQRARSELAHWREYVDWARKGCPTPAQAQTARELVEAKTARYERDTDDDTNAQRRAATEALAHWSERGEQQP